MVTVDSSHLSRVVVVVVVVVVTISFGAPL